ncbi:MULTISPECIES: hypothetical protein [unclassified Chelatococcus]|uniref:hypothetical protein n=1 Tax=unclassified Chelatococcus TaxID=2638111 RepID=UPI001BCD8CE5|nr:MULTISPECIES: hypothetical protein [unclassified Chelatococcus]CAH1665494.1 hypothetical protein CHELA41_22673 [Hyphomicrobiales bacterium]MBS7737727.1 hypothetical protein [Chelatococcus sp. HY11]MBX3544139.1 hypothetical protein [Chelatococcus sp.]MCO5077145.1 hypothetical protein [Chelatococcus sp.]CAH1681301.1 hypothetical protein CHELA20_52246 [Hyphomicrobiales bacterium]
MEARERLAMALHSAANEAFTWESEFPDLKEIYLHLASTALKALNLTDTAAMALMDGEGMVVPNYPAGDVIGPCRCGSWPGGKCFKCPTTDSSPYKETTNE